MSKPNKDGINLSITTPRHRIGAIGVSVVNFQLPPVQHRHVVLVVVVAAATAATPATPGRDGTGGSAKEETDR